MKKVILLFAATVLLCLMFAGSSHAQTRFLRTYQAVSTGNFVGTHMAAHQPTGEISVCGHYSGSSSFRGEEVDSGGSSQAFLMRLDMGPDNTGGVKWIREIRGTGDQRAFGTAVDGDGNSYVIGESTGPAEIQGGEEGTVSLERSGKFMFLAKYSSGGDLLWVRTGISSGEVSGSAIAVDSSGHVYAAGWFTDYASFGGIQVGGGDYPFNAFVAKYDGTGEVKWVRTVTGLIRGIVADGSGAVTVAGEFSVMASFGDFKLTSSGDTDLFVVRYDDEGEVRWARRAGGGGKDAARGLAVDPDGGVVAAGRITGAVDFGGGVQAAGSVAGNGFVARYDSLGNTSWATAVGGDGGSEINGIAVNPSGLIAVTGAFSGGVTFPGKYLESRGGDDVFAAFYSPSGGFISALSAGGASDDGGRAAAWQDAILVVTGGFRGTAAFGDDDLATHAILDGGELFLSFLGDVRPDGTIPGDFNFDGRVNLGDVIGILRMLTLVEDAPEGAIAGDFTENGRVGLEDVIGILQKMAFKR